MELSASPFLRLPRELRDAIYLEYVLVDGGYVFNPDTEKLRRATGLEGRDRISYAIDLSLMYTCQQVSTEMKGVALGANLITFNTLYRHDLRVRAGRYVGLVDYLHFNAAAYAALAYNLCSHRVRDRILAKYSWFEPYLNLATTNHAHHPEVNRAFQANDLIRGVGGLRMHGSQVRAQSLVREAALFALQVCLELEDVHDTLQAHWRETEGPELHREIHTKVPDFLGLAARYTHWFIPSEGDLDILFDILHSSQWCLYGHRNGNDCRTLTRRPWIDSNFVGEFKDAKYRFSAAAAAIRFFKSFPGIHHAMRNLLVHEDRDAVPWSACHGRGLVHFCVENPLLRIERRVDLWWNVFTETMGRRIEERFATTDDWLDETHPTLRRKPTTRMIAQWVMEAAELPQMPPGCFRLTLDGGAPGPADACSEIFQHWVQASAAEQIALGLTKDRGLPMTGGPRAHKKWSGNREDLRTPLEMYFETGSSGFPRELSKIVAGTLVVQCLNFSPGVPHDVEEIVQARRGWNIKEWQDEVEGLRCRPASYTVPTHFNPVSPLPQWIEILMHNLLDYDSARQYAVNEGYL
ncbi:RNA-directed DNA polymerase from mobile element jockey [Apiospora arundinis]